MSLQPSVVTLLFFGMVLVQSDSRAQSFADQPKEQRDAVRKILDLGGDWELSSKTVLIGFIGDKFTNDKFSLLAPLVDLKTLAFFEVPADDRALIYCRNLEELEWLQMDNCKFSGIGLINLAQCKKLKNVCIEETPITDEGLAALAKFDALETLYISHCETLSKITAAGVRKLKLLKKLKHLSIDMTDLPDGLEQVMASALPNCRLWLTGSGTSVPTLKN